MENQNDTQRKIIECLNKAKAEAISLSQTADELDKTENVFNILHNTVLSQFESRKLKKSLIYYRNKKNAGGYDRRT